ncbi:hypothetical protein E2P81_ATG04773 [Venturia nashicola]|nr:hypothetical protein E2P81_ATG04773 [Venturia nashicola]
MIFNIYLQLVLDRISVQHAVCEQVPLRHRRSLVNQLFTNIYVMLVLTGLFLTGENEEKKDLVCLSQAIIVVLFSDLTEKTRRLCQFSE